MAENVKRCVICKQVQPLREFNVKQSSPDGKQNTCRECNRVASMAYYRRSRAKHLVEVKKNNKRYASRLRELKLTYLLDHPCIDCGESNPIVLEFDHIKGTKEANVSQLIWSAGARPTRFQREIAKCVVRCVNCHRRKTAHARGSWRLHAAIVANDASPPDAAGSPWGRPDSNRRPTD